MTKDGCVPQTPPRRALLVLTCALAVLVPSSAAQAQGCVARPNLSASAQYCNPSLSADGGNAAPTAATVEDVLPAKDVRALKALGPLGKALLALPAGSALSPAARDLLQNLG